MNRMCTWTMKQAVVKPIMIVAASARNPLRGLRRPRAIGHPDVLRASIQRNSNLNKSQEMRQVLSPYNTESLNVSSFPSSIGSSQGDFVTKWSSTNANGITVKHYLPSEWLHILYVPSVIVIPCIFRLSDEERVARG